MIDYHIHSAVSGDCEVSMARMVKAAQNKGLREICFAEHLDLDFPSNIDFVVNFDDYKKEFDAVKSKFPQMHIRKGIEAGLDMRTKDKLPSLLKGQDLDYVIGSLHIVFGQDPFYPEFWETFSQKKAYEEYLRSSIECTAACDYFDVLGHLGYIAKFCPHEDKLMRYADFADAIDTLLNMLISKGKGLEVNTRGLSVTSSTMPETHILERFFKLGGEIITIGSDAHTENTVGQDVNETLAKLKDIGFKYICAFDQRRPEFIPIP